MPVINFHVSADNGPKQHFEDLLATWWNLQKEDRATDLVLVSGHHQTRVHLAVLVLTSPLLKDLLPPSYCPCSTPSVTLPHVQGDTLAALVELIYTGRCNVRTENAVEELVQLTQVLQMTLKVNCEKITFSDIVDSVVRDERGAGEAAVKAVGTTSVQIDIEPVPASNATKVQRCNSPLFVRLDQTGEARQIKESKLESQDTRTFPFLTNFEKKKTQGVLNIRDEFHVSPQRKRRKLKLSIQETREDGGFVYIKDVFASSDTDTNGLDKYVLDQDSVEVHDVSDSIEEHGHHESKEKIYSFVCPFCQKKFIKKSSYDKHLSWNHFKEEICKQFPGLECTVCMKRFVKQSNYVFHLGCFHKVADGLNVALTAKLAQVKEANQRKTFTYSQAFEGLIEDLSRITPKV